MLNILYGIVEIFTLSDLWKEALREDKKTNWQSANQSQTCVQMWIKVFMDRNNDKEQSAQFAF